MAEACLENFMNECGERLGEGLMCVVFSDMRLTYPVIIIEKITNEKYINTFVLVNNTIVHCIHSIEAKLSRSSGSNKNTNDWLTMQVVATSCSW